LFWWHEMQLNVKMDVNESIKSLNTFRSWNEEVVSCIRSSLNGSRLWNIMSYLEIGELRHAEGQGLTWAKVRHWVRRSNGDSYEEKVLTKISYENFHGRSPLLEDSARFHHTRKIKVSMHYRTNVGHWAAQCPTLENGWRLKVNLLGNNTWTGAKVS
jgi:hypothetical protein